MYKRIFAALLAAGWALVAAPASAADKPPIESIERGHAIAKQWCISCHVVERAGGRGTDAAPPFAKLADDGVPEARLKAFMANPHPPMPNMSLTRRDMDDLAAYILNLRKG